MVDAHKHFWRYELPEFSWIPDAWTAVKQDALPPDSLQQVLAEGYKHCIAVQARSNEVENDFLLGIAKSHPEVVGVVGWLDLQARGLEFALAHYTSNPLFKGVRHIVQAEQDPAFLARKEFREGIAKLQDYDLAYDILVLWPQLPAVLDFVDAFPHQRFVLDHLGKPAVGVSEAFAPWRKSIKVLAERPNVMAKISGLVTEYQGTHAWKAADFTPYIDTAIEAFTPSRLMLGSDHPVCLGMATLEQATQLPMKIIKQLSETEQSAIYEQNAKAFYRVD